MFGLYTIVIIVLGSLIIAWFTCSFRINRKQAIILSLFFLIYLIIVETFRDGSINPDYDLYLQYIIYSDSYKNEAEKSFFLIADLSHAFGSRYMCVFFIYAIIGISIKLFAIYNYSTNIIYSLCVWLSFSFILHDLIQIRAAVSAALLLLMIPYVCDKHYIKAILVWVLAFIFHNSAILFGIVFILKKDTIVPWKWIALYVVILIINTANLPIFSFIFNIISIFPTFISDRIGKSDPTILNGLPRMTMYSRYVIIPTIFCLMALYHRKKMLAVNSYSLVCLKVCLIGIICYGIGLPIVSERLFEILSMPYIYIVPTSLYWFKKDSLLKGKILITVFCLFMAWNLLYKQEVFS